MLRNTIGDNLGQRWGREFAGDDASYAALGDTDAGRAFVMKALNPSWQGQTKGIPDKTSIMALNYNHEHVETVQIPATERGNDVLYNITLIFYNDLIVLADVIIANTSNPDDLWMSYTVLTPDIPDLPDNDPAYLAELVTKGLTLGVVADTWPIKVVYTTRNYLHKLEQIREQAQTSRRTHYGATAVMNQNTQNDQGTLHGGQIVQTPRHIYQINTANGELIPKHMLGPEDFPTSRSISEYPRSLNALARDGCYAIMRLDEDLDRFRNLNDPVALFCTAMYPGTGAGAENLHGWVSSPKKFIAIANGTIGVEALGNSVMFAYFSNLSPSASLDIRFRYGEESRPMEHTIMKPFWTQSPRLDPIAMQMYSRIISEMSMDMYTADYNRWEWLQAAISKHAPALRAIAEGAMGGIGGGLSGVLMGAANAGIKHYSGSGNKRRQVELVDE